MSLKNAFSVSHFYDRHFLAFTFSTTYQRPISGKRSVQDSNLQGEQTPDRIATGSNSIMGTLPNFLVSPRTLGKKRMEPFLLELFQQVDMNQHSATLLTPIISNGKCRNRTNLILVCITVIASSDIHFHVRFHALPAKSSMAFFIFAGHPPVTC